MTLQLQLDGIAITLDHPKIKQLIRQSADAFVEDKLLSEFISVALFIASVVIYSRKAGRNTWWFAVTLLVLGLFVVLNITLYASDYFTGDGINDAVLYTLTNSLTGAGVSKYILPGIGVVVALVAVFGLLGWILRRRRHHPHHLGYFHPYIFPYIHVIGLRLRRQAL